MNLFLVFLVGCFLLGLRNWQDSVRQQMWMVTGIVFLMVVIYYTLPRYI